MNADSPRLRLSILGIVVFAMFAALFTRLWYLQVMSSEEYEVVAEANRVREVPVEAPRGRILDRKGRVLVDNRVSIQVTIDRTVLRDLEEDERTEVLTKLAEGLSQTSKPTTVAELEDRIADQRYSPYVPVPVASDVPEDLKIWIDERHAELPSVAAERVAVRRYPYGRLAAHVLGYTGKVTKEELEVVPENTTKPYTLNDAIGKSGIERMYEDDLRGTPGVTLLEVDTEGNTIRVIPEGTTAPVPGDDVVLNLDIDVQAQAEQALQTKQTELDEAQAAGADQATLDALSQEVATLTETRDAAQQAKTDADQELQAAGEAKAQAETALKTQQQAKAAADEALQQVVSVLVPLRDAVTSATEAAAAALTTRTAAADAAEAASLNAQAANVAFVDAKLTAGIGAEYGV